MLYTSYFAKADKLPVSIVQVSICARVPEWYRGLRYYKLAPSLSVLDAYKRTHDAEMLMQHYKQDVLAHLDAEQVVNDLVNLAAPVSTNVALLCYEKPTDFCHRHLAAEWLSSHGYPCEEYHFKAP